MLPSDGLSQWFDGALSRREILRIGAIASTGISIANSARANPIADVSTAAGFGKAERCILIYLWGSPSQLETFDPKPDASLEVRGEFQSIDTAIPGVRIGEILPRISRILDRVTILRSLSHQYPIHGTAFALSAVPATDLTLEGNLLWSRGPVAESADADCVKAVRTALMKEPFAAFAGSGAGLDLHG